MSEPFTIYRIIRKTDGRAFVCSSDYRNVGNEWWTRGTWTRTGVFWKCPESIRKHLMNFCYDWELARSPSGPAFYTRIRLTDEPDMSRLDDITIEATRVAEHSTEEIPATTFMGVAATKYLDE